MSRAVTRWATLAVVTTTALGVVTGTAQAAPAPTTARIPGSVAPAAAHSKAVGTVAADRVQNVQLWLQGDSAGAEKYAQQVSTPGQAAYHHYLSPAAYTARFGASAAQANAVRSWLRSKGFGHIKVDPQRNYVRASASTATVAKAFAVTMRTYRGLDARGHTQTFQSNDRDVTVPASIAKSVSAVTGLNSAQPVNELAAPKPKAPAADPEPDNCSTYYGEKVKTGLPEIFGTTTLPTHLCGYTGKQLRSAYGMNSTNTGRGVTVAYIELGAPYKMFSTLTRWAKDNGLPAPVSTRYQELAIGGSGDPSCGNPFDIEEQLDIEAGYTMAPEQRQLLIAGDPCDARLGGLQALFDADTAVLDGDGATPLATIASNSWGFGGENAPASFVKVNHDIMTRAAAEGVGMYFSSGDAPGVMLPAADPNAIAVGGTSLGIGANGQRLFETGWSNDVRFIESGAYDDFGIATAAGGGTSLLYKQPAYQKGVVPNDLATPPGDRPGLDRAAPDISALADLVTGIGLGMTEQDEQGKDVYTTFPEGGTSLASPLVAGMVAAAQQGQRHPFGFADPAFYRLAGTSAVIDATPVTSSTPPARRAVYCADEACIGAPSSVWTFDAEDPSQTDQVTRRGYDTMTGIGVPNGQRFITALRGAGSS
jgi:subtilase family serine protease